MHTFHLQTKEKLQTTGEEKQKCTIHKVLIFKAVDIICR